MPEETPDELPESTPASMREHFDRIKAQRDEARQAAAEAERIRRENVFLRSGVDLDSPLGQMFAKGYDGELDMEAVKASWAELAPGNGTSETPAPSPAIGGELTPEQVAQHQEFQRQQQALNSEAIAPGEEPTPDPRISMVKTYQAEKAKGRTDLAARRAGFQELFNAAAAGDERVLFDRERWLNEQA